MGSSKRWFPFKRSPDSEGRKGAAINLRSVPSVPVLAVAAEACRPRQGPSSRRPSSSPSSYPSSSPPNNPSSSPSRRPAIQGHFTSRAKKPSSLAHDKRPRFYKYETTFSGKAVTHIINGDSEVWIQGERLGSGGYGEVYLHRSPDPKNGYPVRAVKSITRTVYPHDNTKAIKRELNALIALRQYTDHFVDFYGWYEAVDGSDIIFIAMEYLPGGDLYKYMEGNRALAKKNCKNITRQILEALEIMHRNEICHRDLKPQNVLVASMSPLKLKLADFGIAKSTNQGASLMQTAIGSSKYIAPEVLRLTPYVKTGQAYSQAVDMWALGTLAHEIMTGSIPFCDKSTSGDNTNNGDNTDNDDDDDDEDEDRELFTRNNSTKNVDTANSTGDTTNLLKLMQYCAGTAEFPLTISNDRLAYSSRFKDFILCVLYPDPDLRLSAPRALQHPWISENVADHPWYDKIRPPAQRSGAARAEAERAEAERAEAERAEAERAEAERVEAERVRSERANAKILGLRGVFKAVRRFRQAVPRTTATDTEDLDSCDPLDARRLADQRARAEHIKAERAEAERVEAERVRSERANAKILGLRGVFKAAKQFRRKVPRATVIVPEATQNHDDVTLPFTRPRW